MKIASTSMKFVPFIVIAVMTAAVAKGDRVSFNAEKEEVTAGGGNFVCHLLHSTEEIATITNSFSSEKTYVGMNCTFHGEFTGLVGIDYPNKFGQVDMAIMSPEDWPSNMKVQFQKILANKDDFIYKQQLRHDEEMKVVQARHDKEIEKLVSYYKAEIESLKSQQQLEDVEEITKELEQDNNNNNNDDDDDSHFSTMMTKLWSLFSIGERLKSSNDDDDGSGGMNSKVRDTTKTTMKLSSIIGPPFKLTPTYKFSDYDDDDDELIEF